MLGIDCKQGPWVWGKCGYDGYKIGRRETLTYAKGVCCFFWHPIFQSSANFFFVCGCNF